MGYCSFGTQFISFSCTREVKENSFLFSSLLPVIRGQYLIFFFFEDPRFFMSNIKVERWIRVNFHEIFCRKLFTFLDINRQLWMLGCTLLFTKFSTRRCVLILIWVCQFAANYFYLSLSYFIFLVTGIVLNLCKETN